MNSTNRGLNRAFILLVGLVLLAIGAGAVAIASVPTVTAGYNSTAPDVSANISALLVSTPLAQTGSSWLWLVLIVVFVVAIVLLLMFILRQGNGHTRTLISEPATENGQTQVHAAVAEQLLQEALAGRPELVSSHVSTYRVRGEAVLKVSVTCRRGVSPADVQRLVDERLASLDALLGVELPALLQISGGFRTKVNSATRLG
ncbi:MAG: hypothetical protein JWQ43_4088 [Glaciihabitans sp.]|nr:hypothetical protein [Glaciihabitans sp.]